jgi:putative transposase
LRKQRPRLPLNEYIGAKRYLITICTYHRQRYFFMNNNFYDYENILSQTAGSNQFHVIIYCFMPDHVHLLIEGDETSDLIQFLSEFKRLTAYHFKERNNERLWQKSFYDRLIRADESLINAAKYILNNPVRKGLAKSVLDYPFSGSFCFPLSAIIF